MKFTNVEQRHPTNQIYRLVHDFAGAEVLKQVQGAITGTTPSDETIRRYRSGYGSQAIPMPAQIAAAAIIVDALEAAYKK